MGGREGGKGGREKREGGRDEGGKGVYPNALTHSFRRCSGSRNLWARWVSLCLSLSFSVCLSCGSSPPVDHARRPPCAARMYSPVGAHRHAQHTAKPTMQAAHLGAAGPARRRRTPPALRTSAREPSRGGARRRPCTRPHTNCARGPTLRGSPRASADAHLAQLVASLLEQECVVASAPPLLGQRPRNRRHVAHRRVAVQELRGPGGQ